MITISPTSDQVARAHELYSFGALNNSITRGGGNLAGALGEVVVADLIGWKKIESYSYDLQHPDGRTIDVKTKRSRSKPKPHWNCTVAKTSGHQLPDIYFFVRVHENLSAAWLLGWIERSDFYEKANFFQKGDLDPDGNGEWTFKADCWNLEICKLNSVEELK